MNKDKYRIVKYYLYNYNRLDELIKNREEEIIDNVNIGAKAWLRKDKNTVDNQAIKMCEDIKINKIKRWKAFINGMLIFLSKNSFISYLYLKLKFFERKSDYKIAKTLEINLKDLYILKVKLIDWIYKNAKIRNLT